MSYFRIFRKTGFTLYHELMVLKWNLKQAKRLEKFKNKHYGEDCVLICNGPSLNKMDLGVLNDYHTIGLNKIFLIFERVKLNLSYHVAVNKHVIEQSAGTIENLNCPSFLEFEPGIRHVDRKEHIYYVKNTPYIDFYPNIEEPIYQGGTVTFVAMQIAFYLGFKNVYLIGCDHSFAQRGKPNELQTMHGEDVNHFDPNYFKGQKWQLADLDASEISYFMARLFYEKHGRRIIDSTIDGKLDIFEKIPFEEVLPHIKKKKTQST